jgi:ABC-type transport system substrate-binding protein
LSAELQEIDQVNVTSPTTLAIHTRTPIAGVIEGLLAFGDFYLASPTAAKNGQDLNKSPVGAGPFTLQEYRPQLLKLVKNPSYFQAGQIKVASVEFVDEAAGPALVTSLRSGAVDIIDNLPYGSVKEVGGGNIATSSVASDNVLVWGAVCKSHPPFDDVRVRQALNYAIDRDAINKAIFDGRGYRMTGLFGPNSPLHVSSLDGAYKYDPGKAKSLLAEAGQPSLSFDVFFVPGDGQRFAEIVQEQWKQVGVNINIRPLTNTTDFYPDAKGAPMAMLAFERTGIPKVSRTLSGSSVGNVCHWKDVQLDQALAKLQTVSPDSAEAKQLWSSVQQRVSDQAMNVFGLFGVQAAAWNANRLGGVGFVGNLQGTRVVDIRQTYVKK